MFPSNSTGFYMFFLPADSQERLEEGKPVATEIWEGRPRMEEPQERASPAEWFDHLWLKP